MNWAIQRGTRFVTRQLNVTSSGSGAGASDLATHPTRAAGWKMKHPLPATSTGAGMCCLLPLGPTGKFQSRCNVQQRTIILRVGPSHSVRWVCGVTRQKVGCLVQRHPSHQPAWL